MREGGLRRGDEGLDAGYVVGRGDPTRRIYDDFKTSPFPLRIEGGLRRGGRGLIAFMKKVKNRTNSVMIIAGLLIAGICLFLVRLADNGAAWAAFRGNQGLYSSGVLSAGTLYDRNGILLASAKDGIFRYADAERHRRACLHAVGDYRGMIGTGVVTALPDKLSGYSFVTGTYSVDGRGVDLGLTLDAELCATAHSALAGRRGAVLLMDYSSGEILCMVSSPGYDPNNPPDLSGNNPQYEGAYINRCISSVFTPGSVFKLVTLAAALENIPDIRSRTFYCAGHADVDGERLNCSAAHGTQTIEQAFSNSCNCAFGQLSLELGPDVLSKYAADLGLTSAHSMSGIPTAAGSFSLAESGSIELAWSGIGQHEDLVSPYALLRLCAAIANGGTVAEPVILGDDSILGSLGFSVVRDSSRILKKSTADRIADMMLLNVKNSYGSWNFPNLNIGAKTGTAEVGDALPHSWFAGFLREDAHPYAFVVLVENGGAGLGAASSLANTLLQAACK